MFGAIYGDVIGSYYEVHCTKNYDFPFENDSTFTDDSVLIAAVCKTILNDPSEIGRFGVRSRGDADTQACIAGGIAEAFYHEIPEHIKQFCDRRIDITIKNAVREFENKYCK